jgi:hypothetical protein
LATRHITKRNCAKKKDTPPPATAFKICWNKNQQEQIKGCPEVGNAQIRQYTVKKGIALMIINLYKKPLVPLFHFVKEAALNQKHLTKIEERAKYNSNSLSMTRKFFSFAAFYAYQA